MPDHIAVSSSSARRLPAALFFLLAITFSGTIDCRAQLSRQARIDSLLGRLPALKEDTAGVALLNRLGFAYGEAAPDPCRVYAGKALEMAQRLGWNEGIGSSYNTLGVCDLGTGEYKKSMAYWQKALTYYKRSTDKRGLLRVVGNIGVAYNYQGDYAHALENFFLALKYSEELGDKRSIDNNLTNIASAYEYLGEYGKALEYDLRALQLDKELRDTAGMAVTLTNIANIYSDLKRYDLQESYQQQAIAYSERYGDHSGVIRGLVNLSVAGIEQNKFMQGLDYALRAKSRMIATGAVDQEPRIYQQIAAAITGIASDSAMKHAHTIIRLDSGRSYRLPDAAQPALVHAAGYLKRAIALNREQASLDQLIYNYRSLSIIQELLGDTRAALQSHKRYVEIKDSVFSADSKLKVTNLETQREIDLKDKQIEIDRLEVAKKRNERVLFGAAFVLLLIVVVIIIRNVRLSTAKELSENRLNAFQARMNPHFIFNSLSSIQSLILNNETEQSIDYLAEFSTLMRQILDNSGQSKVTLKTEIDMLRSYIELEHLRFDGFQRTITIAENINPESVNVPGMVIQPFVENAILHGLISKGREGQLDITFEKDDKHIICTVEDNGVGRERSAEINRKRSKTRQSHGTAIAINRLLLLADKKRGLTNEVIYIDKMEDGVAAGTKVIIQLPVL